MTTHHLNEFDGADDGGYDEDYNSANVALILHEQECRNACAQCPCDPLETWGFESQMEDAIIDECNDECVAEIPAKECISKAVQAPQVECRNIECKVYECVDGLGDEE